MEKFQLVFHPANPRIRDRLILAKNKKKTTPVEVFCGWSWHEES